MSASEDSGETEAEIGGGRASVESLSEFLKEFKSSRMSFEPLDTWLFVKARDSIHSDVESVSDCNVSVGVGSESDSSAVYHFDSDELSSVDGDNDNFDDDASGAARATSVAASVYAVDDCDVEKPFVIKNLANSPGRSGCGVKVFNEVDRSDALVEDEPTAFDASSDSSFNSRNSVESVKKHTTTQQPALNSVFSLNSQSRVCSYNTYGAYDDHVSETAHHENFIPGTDKSYKVLHNACDSLDKFKTSPEKPCEFAVDAYSGSSWHANQNAVNVESAAAAVSDGGTAVCNSSDISCTGEIDVSDTLKRKNKRQRIAQELMDTETTYQRHLELIVQVCFVVSGSFFKFFCF